MQLLANPGFSAHSLEELFLRSKPGESLKGPPLGRNRDAAIGPTNTRRRMPANDVRARCFNARLAADRLPPVSSPSSFWLRDEGAMGPLRDSNWRVKPDCVINLVLGRKSLAISIAFRRGRAMISWAPPREKSPVRAAFYGRSFFAAKELSSSAIPVRFSFVRRFSYL
jgi:hypothetical protein